MKWVTRHRIRVNRAATAWLIRRFIDRDATFIFCPPEEVEGIQRAEGATGFDAPGARYPHSDERGRCSFEALVDEHCIEDPALKQMAAIVHGADFRDVPDRAPEAAGLQAISYGFPLVCRDDHETVERAGFLYDALYAALRERPGGSG